MNENLVLAIIMAFLACGWIFAFYRVYSDIHQKPQKNITKLLVRTAVFGAIASLLYVVPFLNFPMPFLPPFLKFHFDEVPALIAGFAYGPMCGVGVILIKTLVKLPFTHTLTVGELSDLIYGIVLVLPPALIYKKRRKFSFAILGLVIGCAFQIVVSLFLNIYAMIPFYLFVMGFSEEGLLAQMAHLPIKDLKWGYGLFGVLPFNILKNMLVGVITLLVYKSTHRFIDKN